MGHEVAHKTHGHAQDDHTEEEEGGVEASLFDTTTRPSLRDHDDDCEGGNKHSKGSLKPATAFLREENHAESHGAVHDAKHDGSTSEDEHPTSREGGHRPAASASDVIGSAQQARDETSSSDDDAVRNRSARSTRDEEPVSRDSQRPGLSSSSSSDDDDDDDDVQDAARRAAMARGGLGGGVTLAAFKRQIAQTFR